MNATIAFERPSDHCVSQGRNGRILTSGVEVWEYPTHVDIVPITSRGQPANCRVSISKERKALRELASVLSRMSRLAREEERSAKR